MIMIEFCFLIWFISACLSTSVMIKKDIEPSFWGFVFVLSPILNTYVAIRYFRIDTSGLKDFWKSLNNK